VPTGSLLDSGSAGVVETAQITIDLWVHAIGYGVLAAVLTLTGDRLSWPTVVGAVLAATALGATVELLQWPLLWRTGSLYDGLANALGAAVGTGIASAIRIVRRG
jgi:VanZ family protein